MSKETMPKHVIFKAKVDNVEKEFMARLPNVEEQREGQKIYNRAWTDAVKSGALLRSKLEDFMIEQKIWTEEKQQKVSEPGREINSKEKILAKGGIKLSEAKKLALDLKRDRLKLRELISKRMELDVHTAEGQADNERFNYWVSTCLVYNDTKKKVFNSLDDYLNRSSEDYAVVGASKLAELLYNLNSNFENNLEENQFLREFNFVDDQGRLINEDGKLIDEFGKLIDEEGYYVDEEGNRVDVDGNPVDDDGNYKFEKQPFLDDDGNPVKRIEAVEEAKEEATETEPETEKVE
jgi:hypothetical protein